MSNNAPNQRIKSQNASPTLRGRCHVAKPLWCKNRNTHGIGKIDADIFKLQQLIVAIYLADFFRKTDE